MYKVCAIECALKREGEELTNLLLPIASKRLTLTQTETEHFMDDSLVSLFL